MDPNVTLHDLREAIKSGMFGDASAVAGDLVDWLDRGGFLPNDWQPFNGSPAGAEAETFDAAARAAQLAADIANLNLREADWQITAALQAAYDCGTDDRSPTQGERDLQADYDRQREELAAFAKSLGDCNTDRCRMAIETNKANRERDQAIKARDAALSMARDQEHQAGRRIDALTRDLDHTREELEEAHEAAGRLTAGMLAAKTDLDAAKRYYAAKEAELTADLAATLATLEGHVNDDQPADRHQRDAWALLARVSASIARDAATTSARNARAVKISADLYLRRHDDDHPAAQLAAMLAVGAARYASKRRNPDAAQRTADHLDQLADRIAGTTSPEAAS